MLNKKMLGVVAVSLSTIVATSAIASQPGAYFGAQAGYGNVHQEISKSDRAELSSSSSKDTGVAGRLFAGYQFNSNFAGELGWSKFSNAELKGSLGSIAVKETIKTDAVDLVAKGILPVANNISVYGKAGVAYVLTRADAKVTGATFDDNETTDSDSTHKFFPTVGVGASYEFTPNVSADLSYNRIQKTGSTKKDDLNPNSTDLVSIGLIYNIG